MKLTFITVLHNLKLDDDTVEDINIFDDVWLSNNPKTKNKILDKKLLQYTVGTHSIREFNRDTYLYFNKNIPHIVSKEQMDEIANQYTFSFLRKAQSFAQHLWKVKDNNIYVRDGFLIAYENDIEDGFTYKASLSAIFTKSTINNEATFFSKDELMNAGSKFTAPKFTDFNKDSFGGKFPSSDHFFKSSKSTRMDRAQYFILSARANVALPIKIVMYITALECLFATSKGEITHKIAERVALYVGTTPDSKLEWFNFIKKAYGYRSKLIHGDVLGGVEEDLEEFTKQLDELLRYLVTEGSEIFEKKQQELNAYFTELIFQETMDNPGSKSKFKQLI